MSFKNALDSEGSFLIMYMPMSIEGDTPSKTDDYEAQFEPDILNNKLSKLNMPNRRTVQKKASRNKLGSASPRYERSAESEDNDERENNIHGALIYEEPVTGELMLNFYTSSLQSLDKDRLDYP